MLNILNSKCGFLARRIFEILCMYFRTAIMEFCLSDVSRVKIKWDAFCVTSISLWLMLEVYRMPWQKSIKFNNDMAFIAPFFDSWIEPRYTYCITHLGFRFPNRVENNFFLAKKCGGGWFFGTLLQSTWLHHACKSKSYASSSSFVHQKG